MAFGNNQTHTNYSEVQTKILHEEFICVFKCRF